MVKFYNYELTFSEVPDEVCLCINITNCQHKCVGCHSPFLREDIGDDLTEELPNLLKKYYSQITCICFLGEGNDIQALQECISYCKTCGFTTAVYSGSDDPNALNLYNDLDYIKIGSYKEEYGPLNKPTTNQKMFKKMGNKWIDITSKFWPESMGSLSFS